MGAVIRDDKTSGDNRCKYCEVRINGGDTCYNCREKKKLIHKIRAMIIPVIKDRDLKRRMAGDSK
jgi:hypothetical protein